MKYEIFLKPKAEKEFYKLNPEMKIKFSKHFEKLAKNFRPKKHLKYGLPYFVEEVTDSARFSFYAKNNILVIIRCFKNHKEYETWYKSKK